MRKETKKAPTIRFRGFTDDWEQRKLSEYLVTSTDKNHAGRFSRADVLSVSGELGIINQIEFQGRSFAGASVLNYGIVKTNDIVYTKSPLKVNPYGIIKANAGKSGIVSTLYAIYHPKKNTDSKFIECYFDSNDRLNHYLRPLVNKGAKNDMKVMNKDVLKGKVDFPPTMKEQRIIASFITEIEMTTALYQRKLDQLKKLKKYFLQNMFPTKGEKVPRIRFKGFTGDWEQRKLSKVVSVCSGMDYKHLSTGNIPVYGTGGYMLSVNKALSYDRDAIGIGRKGTIDKPYILRAPFWTVDTLFYAIPQNEECIDFVYDLFQNVDWKKKDESTGVPSLSKVAINNTNVIIPSEAEQRKIGSFTSQLDILLTLHQRKLNQLLTMKKFMLQNLFI